MSDPARVKQNIRRMMEQGATEADIEGYVSAEGITDEQIRAVDDNPNAFLNEPATDPFGRMLGQTVGQSQGRGYQIADNLTFGLGAEIAGAANDVKRMVGLSDRESADVMKDWDRIRTGYAEENPLSAAGLGIVGAAPTMLIPGLGAARVAQGARAGLRPAMTEGLKLGAKYGVVSIPGRADISPDDTAEEATGKLMGSAIREPLVNAAGGAVGAGLGQVIGKGYDATRKVLSQYGTPKRAAQTTMNKALAESGTTAKQLLDEMRPAYKTLSGDQVGDYLTVYRDALSAANGNPRVAASQAAQKIARQTGGKPATVRKQLVELIKRYDEKQGQSPLFLAEQSGVNSAAAKAGKPGATDADLLGFDDDEARRILDYTANQPGKGATEVRAAIGTRARHAQTEAEKVLLDAVGGDDFDNLALQLDDQMKTAGAQAYKAAEQAERAAITANKGVPPVKPLIERIIAKNWLRFGQRAGSVSDALKQGIQLFERKAAVQGQMNPNVTVTTSMRDLIDARGSLRKLRDGFDPGTAERRVLDRLYNEVTVAMKRSNPQWWKANQIWGDARNGEAALKLGMSFPMKPGMLQRKAVKLYNRMPAPMQHRFRVALMTKWNEAIKSGSDTSDVTKWVKTENGREVLRHIFGDKQAEALFRKFRDLNAANATAKMIGGSQTGARQATREAIDQPLDTVASTSVFSPGHWLNAAVGAGKQAVKGRRNVHLGRYATTRMSRPEEAIPALRELQMASKRGTPGTAREDMARRLAQALIVGAQGNQR